MRSTFSYVLTSLLFCFISLAPVQVRAAARQVLALTLREAEDHALAASDPLKVARLETDSAHSQAGAQYQQLLPKLTLQGSYQYFHEIPQVGIGPVGNVPFGTNNVFSVGPALTYTLFDGFSMQKTWHASQLLEEARQEDLKSTTLQVLQAVRSAYVQVQLGIDELRAIYDSWQLAWAQHDDVVAKFHAGAASRLELVTAERSVLSYELQFRQRQSDLAGSVRDLLALLDDRRADLAAVEWPGPPGNPETRYELKLDALGDTLREQSRLPLPRAPTEREMLPPSLHDPATGSLLAQAESYRLNSESQGGRSYPVVQLSASVNYNRPDAPNPPDFWQESVGATVAIPLFLGDPSRAQAAQLSSEAEATERRARQRQQDVRRDLLKALAALENLRRQRELATRDVTQSAQEARLYYTSYKAGKINFIDVQNANVQELQARVNASRVDAQLIQQIILIRSLGASEGPS